MRLETKADWARAKREPEATIFYIPGACLPSECRRRSRAISWAGDGRPGARPPV